ncbi:DNA packaging protein [Frigidibacter sp. MR17.14]|uniref:DNA packaging protein n=1 Tax=Frigidibacter sp. MR17.14 TaxID=3126509 RepID=UPI003012E17E
MIPAHELAEIEELAGSPHDCPVTADTVAGWLGTTAPRINTLAREGRIPRRPDKLFDLRPAVRAYVADLKVSKGNSALANNPELNAEKIRLARATAEKLETANLKAKGELAPLADVEKAWAGVLRDVRAALLALPSRAASRLGHLTPHDVATIDREVRAVLEELASHE